MEEEPKPEEPQQEKEETDDIEADDFKDGFKNLSAFCKKNHYRIIAVGMLFIALVGMWFCYGLGFRTGAVTMCENSGGTPLLKNSNDIKDGQCLIKYDSLGGLNNNLGLSELEVRKFEEGMDDR